MIISSKSCNDFQANIKYFIFSSIRASTAKTVHLAVFEYKIIDSWQDCRLGGNAVYTSVIPLYSENKNLKRKNDGYP